MKGRKIGPQDECVQCGESKAAIRASQRRGGLDVLFCAIVDCFGECEVDWDRHRFIWTQRDVDRERAETAYWEVCAFNEEHPIGTPILAYPGVRPDEFPNSGARTLDTRTRSKAWVLSNTAVVMVEDYPGGIALSHIDVNNTREAA